MAVIKEFRCKAHGPYEAFGPACPYGCSERMQVREIRTAPGFSTPHTQMTDQVVKDIASENGLTNMSNRGGNSVMENLKKATKATEFAPSWGKVGSKVNVGDLGIPKGENNMPSRESLAASRPRTMIMGRYKG